VMGNFHGPFVVKVVAVTVRNNKARVCDAFHFRENPFRSDRSGGPSIAPA
jgi:hypothetical protein